MTRTFMDTYLGLQEDGLPANHAGEAVRTWDRPLEKSRRRKKDKAIDASPVAAVEANDEGDAAAKARFHSSMSSALDGHIRYARKRGDFNRVRRYERQKSQHDVAHRRATEIAATRQDESASPHESVAYVERQDRTGVWRRIDTMKNDPQRVLLRMREVQQAFPGTRVRAVDSKGRLLDILA
jgi:hypothetical protein